MKEQALAPAIAVPLTRGLLHELLRELLPVLLHLLLRWLVIAALILLAACASTPRKKPLPPAAQAQIAQLRAVALAERLPIPVKGIKAARLSDTWGAARSHGRRHEGIDIMAKRGSKVLSATPGVVVDLRDNSLGGKVIWIAGPAGSYHYYAHLDKHKRGLDVGDRVKKGQVIGYVGNSGNARGGSPHLHYGIYLNGKGRGAVNPYLYLFRS